MTEANLRKSPENIPGRYTDSTRWRACDGEDTAILLLWSDSPVLEGALSIFEIWWTRGDSNPRLPRCEQWGK
jgi:hypothetical protein